MVNAFESFVSRFNFGLATHKRAMLVANTSRNRELLSILKEFGYITSFSLMGPHFIRFYYNFSFLNFKLRSRSKTSNRFLTYAELRSASNSGCSFVVSTSRGYMLSGTALVNGLGGCVILEFIRN